MFRACDLDGLMWRYEMVTKLPIRERRFAKVVYTEETYISMSYANIANL